MAESVIGIQPAVLRWARQTQGYSVDDVAMHLKRHPEEIVAWEEGDSAPTYAQLETLAYKLYKRPLAVFFLPEPPSEPDPKKEFRTLPDFELDRLAADTRYQIRWAQALQLSLKELNDGANPSDHKIFRDVKLVASQAVSTQATAIREHLRVPLSTQKSWATDEEALKTWREAVQDSGVFVFKHSFKQKAISGFCLIDDEFPLIYLNNSNTKTRQIFSLLHELAHVLLHQNSISTLDQSALRFLSRAQLRLEQFCNAIAAEVLVPSSDFNAALRSARNAIDDAAVGALARRYHVSREVILRRLLDRGLVSQTHYESKSQEWIEESSSREKGEGGNYYATQATYLGDRYLQLVFSKHYQGKLSLEQVADYFGVKTKSVAGLEQLTLRKTTAA